ncbi:uncharacterized protein NMK_2235 [Novimethylophilus kurashikiensis]|uniref:Uncharacterized protein n=2 Tax=Novimethylophilus kurashikiensis TaxID=1825523 RepID=A0A2R5F8T1_9PROT|nr:uncharacterized protein NMK_2235 [Novimethylophilus kurashikiensis]
MVTADSGFMQQTRLEAISFQRLVLTGHYTLPIEAPCRLEILIPPLKVEHGLSVGEMQGKVESVIFAGEVIRLMFKLDELSPEVRKQIDLYHMDAEFRRDAARFSIV